MNLLKTKSFELAIYARGDRNASKLAIVIPGRLDTKDYAHNISLVDYLAAQGYYALSFDPPGTWESPGDINIYNTTAYLRVINELIDYFGNKPTLLLGHSRGGSVAMLAAANPSVIGIVAILASYGAPTPPSAEAVRNGFQIEYRDLPPGTSRSKKPKHFELPIAYFKDGEQYVPADALRELAKPKLLIYGDEDEFTEPQRVEEIYKSIPEPKTLQSVHSEHDYRLHSEVMKQVNDLVGSFLARL
jgi:pimeloyl-ACP methyl ester carboxylesterase